MKKTFYVFAFFLVCVSVFAGAGAEMQSTVVSPDEGLTKTSFDMSQAYPMPTNITTFGAQSGNKLFSFSETVEKPKENGSYVASKSWDLTIEAAGENSDGFYFVHESNKSLRINYNLECAAFVATANYNGTNYEISPQTGGYSFVKNSSNKYTLTYPGIEFDYYSGFYGLGSRTFSKHQWLFEIYLILTGSATYLEEGFYTSYIRVKTTVTGNGTRTTQSGGLDIDEVYCIRAHYGVDVQDISIEVFSVIPGSQAYSIQMKSTGFFNVMSLYFSYSDSGKEVKDASPTDKYNIYISSSSNLNEDAHFTFRQIGTAHLTEDVGKNALGYDIYISTTSDATKMQFPTTKNSSQSFSGTGGIGSTSKGQYYVKPEYSSIQTSSGGMLGGKNEYTHKWELDAKIWVKMTGETANLNAGLYESNLYIIVETMQ